MDLDSGIRDQFFRDRTFLFAGVLKSEELKQGQSKDAVLATFDAYHRMLERIAHESRGHLDETDGDAVLYSFDTAADACAAALAVLKAMPEFNETQNRLKSPLAVIITANTGRVVVEEGRSVSELFRETIDVVKHLQTEGKGSDVLITQSTYDAISDKAPFKKDKVWDTKRIQLHRHSESADDPDPLASSAAASGDLQGVEKFTPILDINGGKSFLDIPVGGRIWVKRPGGAVAEGVVTMSTPEGDFGVMVLALPDGKHAQARLRTTLLLCTDIVRAQQIVLRTAPTTEFQRFEGNVPAVADQKFVITTAHIQVAALGAGILVLLILIIVLLT